MPDDTGGKANRAIPSSLAASDAHASVRIACLLIALAVLLASLPWALTPIVTFDEFFYIPAANALLTGDEVLNREHPMLGKELIALSIAAFGDNPLGWRFVSLVSMPMAVWFAMRALWNFTQDRQATIVFGMLLATSGLLFVLGRLATLDAPMLMFTACGIWCVSLERRTLGAIAFGLALACKWTIAPLLPLLAVALAWRAGGKALVTEGARFGIIPAAVYALTFAPGFFVTIHPFEIGEFGHLHLAMFRVLTSYNEPSPYASLWWQWLANTAPFWTSAEPVGQLWRFVVLIVNPVSAYFILPAVAMAWWHKAARWPALFFLAQIALAMGTDRVQFVHQYALPMTCGFAAVSLVLARANRIWGIAATALAAAAFVAMYPVLSGAPLASRAAGERYAFLNSWRIVDFRAWSAANLQGYDERLAAIHACLEQPAACNAEFRYRESRRENGALSPQD